MKLSDFMYDLPEERIAQTPVEPRDHSRLMVLDRGAHTVERFERKPRQEAVGLDVAEHVENRGDVVLGKPAQDQPLGLHAGRVLLNHLHNSILTCPSAGPFSGFGMRTPMWS